MEHRHLPEDTFGDISSNHRVSELRLVFEATDWSFEVKDNLKTPIWGFY
jgi:hypothetical protein